MNPKLLHNRELDNYEEQDNFNFLTKAEAIKVFLEQNSTSLEKNKMIVLYGDWGSGKTSLMKHIEQTINPIIYKSIFFHAWEHEKDENLALSLCDALTDSLDRNSQIVKDFMKGALLAFKSFASGVTLKAPGFLTGLGMDFEFSVEKYIKAIDDALKSKNPSFFLSNKEFKKSFIEVENLVLKASGAQKILVFVDDLDRCEPENVLNLITALKLFFTYGEKTVFFSGMDKEAVTKAVKTKYKDVVKSEEYLEKVFDVAFNMPKIFSLKKMIEPHFKGGKEDNSDSLNIIEDFFKSIKFTNPRHLKKILSKYEIIKSFKVLSSIPKEVRELIPNIIEDDKEGDVFETIFCLFFIILYEFHIDRLQEIENYEQKNQKYLQSYTETNRAANDLKFPVIHNNYNMRFTFNNVKSRTISTLINDNEHNLQCGFAKFLLILSPSETAYLNNFSDGELSGYVKAFNGSDILTLYCYFLIKHYPSIKQTTSNYIFWNLFEMVKYLL